MRWGGWSRKPSVVVTTIVGLDVNAGRIRAVGGSADDSATRSLALTDRSAQLPMLASLDQRTIQVGWPAFERVRLLPHAVCRDFLPDLGMPRVWPGPRGPLNSEAVLAQVASQLRPKLPLGHSAGCVLPGYLSEAQIRVFTGALESAGVHLAGSTSAPLAIAATQQADFGTALVLDADEHALTWFVLTTDGPNARLLAHQAVPAASLSAWVDRLIDGIADRCVLMCRRDPRDSAVAEQAIYEQIHDALDRMPAENSIHVHVRTAHWYQDLRLATEDFESMAAPLTRLAIDSMRQAAAAAHSAAPVMARPDLVWITADAAKLPGLVSAVTQNVPESTTVKTLTADALASAGCQLADRWLSGELARGHFGAAIARPARPAEAPRRSEPDRLRSQRG